MSARLLGEGRVRPWGWTTVTVDLVNQGGDLTGELVIAPEDPGGMSKAEYVVEVTLPAGGKKRVSVDLPIEGNGTELKVQLKADGREIKSQKVSLTLVTPDSPLIGLLSEDELGLPALSQLRFNQNTPSAQVIRLDAETFPTKGTLLDTFDVIAISRFDTSTLSKEQLQALEAWVAHGGRLVLAGGPEWKRTLAALPPSLVPVAVTGTRDVALQPLAALTSKPLAGQAQVSDGKVVRGTALASSGETPLVVQAEAGSGKVLYVAFDPGLQPLVGWAGQVDLYGKLLDAKQNWNQMPRGRGAMVSALQSIPGLSLPEPVLVAVLVFGYLLVIGPLSYFILKRLDRREWLWVTVPILSLAFVGTAYGVTGSKWSSLLSHRITVTELAPGMQTGRMYTYTGVYAPTLRQLSVPVTSQGLVTPLTFYGQQDDRQTRLRLGEKKLIEFDGMNNYSMQGFATEQDLPVSGGIELVETTMDADGVLMTRVVNRLDQPLTDLQVYLGGASAAVGRLEPGETSDVIRITPSVDATENIRQKMQLAAKVSSEPGEPRALERQRLNILNDIFNSRMELGQSDRILVTAWTERPLVEETTVSQGRFLPGANLIYAKFPLKVDMSTGTIPPGLIQGVLSESDTGFGGTTNIYELMPGNHEFTFTLPSIPLERIADLRIHMLVLGAQPYTLSARNVKTGEWVELKAEPVQSLPDWRAFIGPNNGLAIRISNKQHLTTAPPTISTKGVTR